MKQKNFWLRTLNVRPDEGWLVKKLFLLQFLQGTGIAFFFTSSFALFLDRLPITELPYAFIYSSLLLWIIGFIYSRIEHKFNISKLAIIITVFMIISMLLFRLAFELIRSDWFLYWMLAWFHVLYLLNNLEFWGIASLLFDARQSKRLFSVISAGDIPAKFIGYTLALFTVEYVGTINLLWMGVICMAASIPFLASLHKSGKILEVQHKNEHHSEHSVQKVSKIVKNFSGNTLIRRLATLSIIVTGSFIIINFAFYAGVKATFHDDVSLAKFIALFLAIVRLAAMGIKMIFTGRLINRLGIIKSLLITPVVLVLLICTIILTQNLPGYQRILIYLFGATYIVVDILRSAINSPVFLTFMQPLSNHERLRAHTIVKGIMDPFASLFAGAMLLLFIRYQHRVDLLTISYALLGICVFWIIGIYRVNSQYLKTIVKTISSRYFNLENFSISDSGTLDWLKEKTKTSSELEVINILNMLYQSSNLMSDELMIAALQHPSEKVKTVALRLIGQKSFPSAPDFLLPFLQYHNSPLIVAETIKILCRNGADNNTIIPFLENKEPSIRQAALTGLFFYGSDASKNRVSLLLIQMIASENPGERMMVADILSTQENSNQIEMILQLMNDESADVRKTAFLAAGKSGNEQLLQELMNRIDTDEIKIIQPLFIAGELSLPFIHKYITGAKATSLQKEKLILVCGSIGGGRAQKILLNLLTSHPAEYMTVIKAIYRSNYALKPEDGQILIAIAKKMLSRCAALIYMQSSLQSQQKKYQLLNNSFNLELNALRESLLYVFALLYSREHINKVRTAYATGKKENIINAMEIIDIAVRKDLAGHFNTIFEPGNIAERMHGLRKIYPVEFFENVELVLVRILGEDIRPYNNWTMACCLYTSKKQKLVIDRSLIKKYTSAENILLRETALFAI
ncbi:MAG: HEAT repeat domain-containing protein [Ferruginibacter sp.]